MNDLVQRNEKGIAITNSLLVAKKFNKNHAHVLRDIEDLGCSIEFRESNFGLSSYTSQQNKELPMYEMTKDGFSFLVMGYTGQKAAKFKEDFIIAFNKMEALLNSDDYILMRSQQILTNRVNLLEDENRRLIEDNRKQEERLRIDAPKVQFAESFKASSTIYLMRDLAKYINQNICKMGEVRLYEWMVENKYLIKSKRWSNSKQKYEYSYMPTQRASDMKIFHIVPTHISSENGDYLFTRNTIKLTSKGQTYFINKFLELNKQAI